MVVFAAIILPTFLRNRIATVTEYLELRFDRKARVAYSIFTLLTLLLIDTAGALYAGAVVMQTGLPVLNLWSACILISLFVGAYTIFGGLRAVVFTDTLQAVVLIIGAATVAGYGLYAVGGWDSLLTKLDARQVDVFRAANDPFLPLVLAAEHSERIQLMTSIAVAFARNPMIVANIGNDLQAYSKGRFILGLNLKCREE